MIAIAVRDFRGCERADLLADPICMVAGVNAAGKSSIAQAVAAVLTGNGLTIGGVGKGSAGTMVRTGASDAIAEVADGGGTAKMAWPICRGATAGEDPPQASVYAAGSRSIVDMDPSERARVLNDYLHAAPSREDFVRALADQGLADEAMVVTPIWKLITDKGWDAAHAERKERGATMKGQWKQVAGANFGARIAAAWQPQGWSDDLGGADEATLLTEAEERKRRYEAAIGAAAVSQAERAELGRTSGEIDARRANLANLAASRDSIAKDFEAAEAARAAVPSTGSERGMPCPHCGHPVVLRRIDLATQKLEKAEEIEEGELKRRRGLLAGADGRVSNLRAALAAEARKVEEAGRSLEAADSARARLAELDAKPAVEVDVEKAKEAHELAITRLQIFRQKLQADDLRDKIASNETVLDILAGDGLRARKLSQVLDLFNSSSLIECANSAGWKPVTVAADMTIAYGGRPYVLLSQSEQYRTRAVLQIAMARLDGSRMVVFDAADVLDAPTRSGLFSLLADVEIPALVCMTLSRRDQLPDLQAAGLGQSVWIERGITTPISTPAEQAA